MDRDSRHCTGGKDIIVPTKVCLVKTIIFPVVMYRRKSHNLYGIEKAECQRTDTFKLSCWRRLLRVPSTARANQSLLKEINPEYSLERLMLKLKCQYFGQLMWRAKSQLTGKDFDAGEDWGQEGKVERGWNGWMTSLTQWASVWANSEKWWRTGKPGVLQFMGLQRVRDNSVTEQHNFTNETKNFNALSKHIYRYF